MKTFLLAAAVAIPFALCEERKVDPTWLRRFVPELNARAADVTTATCRYKPIFGAGDPDAPILRAVARFGEMTIDPGGASAPVAYQDEEQVYVILEGSGAVSYAGRTLPVRPNDFLYLPPRIRHGVSNPTQAALRLLVMGFRVPKREPMTVPSEPQIANIEDVKLQTVAGHPPTVLYRLLMGDATSKRDKIAAGHVLTSLFLMEFEPGGTNFPHHHEQEEEIYVVLEGRGDIVAGGGGDGIEGRHAAKAGDAYFFRLNCTAGFYASKDAGSKARILAVRSRFPFGR